MCCVHGESAGRYHLPLWAHGAFLQTQQSFRACPHVVMVCTCDEILHLIVMILLPESCAMPQRPLYCLHVLQEFGCLLCRVTHRSRPFWVELQHVMVCGARSAPARAVPGTSWLLPLRSVPSAAPPSRPQ